MIPIAELVAELLAAPSPVLCLDTCDILDGIRGVQNDTLNRSRSFVRIGKNLTESPSNLRVVITYLVKHEWEQNLEFVRIQALGDLQKKTRQVEVINEARVQVGLSTFDMPNFDGPQIIDGLIGLARGIIDRATALKQDRECIDRALERVMTHQRPSHKNMIKDSIHLEHYLELSRQLKAKSFGERCYFVSGNKADFWAEKDKSRLELDLTGKNEPRLHPDLEPDLIDAGLIFEPMLERAVSLLGI